MPGLLTLPSIWWPKASPSSFFFFLQVSSSSSDDSGPEQHQMSLLLSEAFQTMRAELDALPLSSPGMLGVEGGLGGVGEVKTAALLEEYSLLLLQAVHRRINSST